MSGDRATNACVESKVKFDGVHVTVPSRAHFELDSYLNLDTEMRDVATVSLQPQAPFTKKALLTKSFSQSLISY